MINLKKKKIAILILFGIALALILVASANTDAAEIISDESNKNAEMTPQSAGYTYKDIYTVGRVFNPEYKVYEIDALGMYNMGDAVFHIRGKLGSIFDTSTTRANIALGLNNPYFEESGSPISYEIKCHIRYKNWNDDNGYVKLYMLHDWGIWVPIWEKSGLTGGTWEWDVSVPVSWPVTDWYTRADGSMDFMIQGCSWVEYKVLKPSCKVNIWDLRVTMKYDQANVHPVGEVYSVCQFFTPEYKVYEIDSLSGTNTGDGVFHIRGDTCPWTGSSTTRASLNFGFNNPVYSDLGLPTMVDVKFKIRYKNWNDHGGYVKFYIQHDDESWDEKWVRTGLTGGEWTWYPSLRVNSDYYRDDGSMSFKVVGTSWIINKWPEKPSCQVNIYDLRVKLGYTPHADPGGPYSGYEGTPIDLDASASSDPTGNTLWYRWDFDNNGIWDTGWSINPLISHAWNDDYSGDLRLQVYNGLVTDIHTTNVDIQNVAPSIDLGPDVTVDEGVIDLSSFLTINDPGSADTHTMEWDFGDGSPHSSSSSHTFDDGTYTVTVTVTDDDGGVSNTDSFVITVNNVAPIIDLGPDIMVYEGYYAYPTIIDPGPDTFTYEWDLGGGTIITTPYLRFNDDGIYAVTLTVTDDDGGVSNTDSFVVTVYNVAPIVYLGPDRTVNEGYYAYPMIFDPGYDTFTYEWDLGGGTIITTSYLRFNDNGIYSVTLTVTDDDGGIGTDSFVVTVNNVVPTVNAGPDQTVNEGQNVHFHGSFSDPGWDWHYYFWDFGDGTPIIGWTLSPSHIYADEGIYTVTLTVIDDDGAVGIDTLTVIVNNVAPTVDAGDDQTVDEGQIVSFSGTFTDPGEDTHTYLWDFDDGTTESGTLTPSHVYADNGVYTVTLTVTDDEGGVGSDTLIVTVDNVAPTVDVGADQTIDQGDEAIFIGTFTDPGSADTHIYLWDFGDGITESGTLTPSHVYAEYGVYTVTLTVTDDDGGVGSDTLTVEVKDIIDPTTTLTFQPQFGAGPTYYVSTTTEFVLTAEDNLFGSGIDIIQYRIGDEDEWSTYDEPFSISEIGGPYTVYYRSIDKAGNVETEKSVDVIVNASELTYTGEVSGVYSDPVSLEAILIDIATQESISGKTIIFTIGTQTVTAETDLNGIAYATLVLDQIPGEIYIVSVSFVNDGEYLTSSDESAFTINKEYAYAEYTGDIVVPLNADTITLRATVFDQDDGYWGDLTKIYVTITIMDSMTLVPLYTFGPLEVEITIIDGVGVAIITIPNLPEEGYLVQISFDPDENDYYWGYASDYATLIIYEPTGDFVTGGGWIEDANGNKGNFGFNVKYLKNGLPKGQAIYIYREGDYVFIVKANAWVGMAIIPDDNYAIFEAKCNVKQIDAITGEIVWEEGNYRLIIEVWDNSQDGKEDVIQIRVRDKIGLIYHEAGFDPYGYLCGGNIVIHIDEKA